jgi:acetoacetate decarboxylase
MAIAADVAAPQIPVGLQGKLTKENFGPSIPSYAPLYPKFGPEGWWWTDIDAVLIDYMTNAEAAAEFLPAHCNLVGIPMAPGQSAVKMLFANYRGGTLPPYLEVIQNIPCLYKGELYLYVCQIWVDTDSAMTSGRELGGFPKKMADMDISWHGELGTGYLERSQERPIGSGKRIASYTFKKTGKMLSLPLPANRKPTFPFPYNLTLPLPEPSNQPQGLPFKTLSTRFIADIGSEKNPWALSQLNGLVWTLAKGELWAGEASLAFHPSEDDPLYKLPVNQILDAMVFYGDMNAKSCLCENW